MTPDRIADQTLAREIPEDTNEGGAHVGRADLRATAAVATFGPSGATPPETGMLEAFDEPEKARQMDLLFPELNQLADKHGIECLRAGSVEIWALKPSFPYDMIDRIVGRTTGMDLNNLEASHRLYATVKGSDNPDQIWENLQPEKFPEPGRLPRRLVEGDIIRDPARGTVLVAGIGFTRMAPLPGPSNGPLEPWQVPEWVRQVEQDSLAFGGKGLAALDTETTGLKGAVIEVGLVGMDGQKIFHEYVLPEMEIEPEAAAVHGLTKEKLVALGAKPWAEVSMGLAAAMRCRTILQYSYNFFDKEALERTDRLAGVRSTAEQALRWVDGMVPYQRANGLHKAMSLAEAAKGAGVEFRPEEAHSALADAKAAMEVFQSLRQHRLVLGPDEVLVRKGENGLESFDAAGKPHDPKTRTIDQLNAALVRNLLGKEWKKPEMALKTLGAGGYIRLNLEQ